MYISKKEARHIMKLFRDNLNEDEVASRSIRICNNIIRSGFINDDVRYVLSFASFRSEPDTSMIDAAIREIYPDIKIAYPRVEVLNPSDSTKQDNQYIKPDGISDKKEKNMQFYIVDSYSELKKGYMNIHEPDADIAEHLMIDKINSIAEQVRIIVPGLAFDIAGRRAGYGGGFYDRFLGCLKVVTTIGICFDEQLMRDKRLMCDEYDISVKCIVTDNEVARI